MQRSQPTRGAIAESHPHQFFGARVVVIKAGVHYQEALIWTTTKDDRVGPQHARKFAAKLAAMMVPYLFYEVVEGGHGAGATPAEHAQTAAIEYTYFTRKLMSSP